MAMLVVLPYQFLPVSLLFNEPILWEEVIPRAFPEIILI